MYSVGTAGLWTGFFIFVLIVLAIDMVLLGQKKEHKMSMREACTWTIVWIACAFIFNLILWLYLSHSVGPAIAHQKALEFLTGYLIEESLSFDNMFVFIMIFSFFTVSPEHQRRVLLYGVIGAVVLRFVMIFSGIWLINQFHWLLYLFGIFLVYTGIKMFFGGDEKKDLAENRVLIWLRQHIRITERFHQEKFFIRDQGFWYATPLFLVLVLIEVSDLIFALDSIPAIFAVTRDPFIVFTSNIFAILGLRAIYFLLASVAARFYLLKYGIALVLMFIGAKMLVEHWVQIPVALALCVVATILLTTILLSLIKRKNRHGNT